MNIRLHHARILTMEPDREIFWGEVWVKNGKIAYVGESEAISRFREEGNLPEIKWEEEIDCGGNLLMPGFKNAHTHSAMTFLRSYADDMPLQEWLHSRIFPAEAKLTPDDIYCLTKLAVLEYLTSGVTAVFDMYIDPGAVARACMDMGMRCVLVSGLNDFTSSVRQMEEEYKKWNGEHDLISYRLGFHAEYTCSRNLLEGVAQLAGSLHAPVYAHMSETKKEVEECLGRYGMTPVAFLDTLGMFEYGGGGFPVDVESVANPNRAGVRYLPPVAAPASPADDH